MKRISVSIVIGVMLAVTATVAIASRNSSGTYSVTASGTFPFVPGTSISSATMNSVFSDLSTEMTDSLSRSGKGGMLAPLRTPDGSVTAPAWSFSNETGSGLYRIGSHDFGLSVNQTKTHEWTSTGEICTGTFQATGTVQAAGSVIIKDSGSANTVSLAAPSLSSGVSLTLPNAVGASVAAAPTLSSATPSSSGGYLASATYYYKVSAITLGGEGTASGELSAGVTGPTGSVALAWTAVTGAVSYKVYRGTGAGSENVFYRPGNVTSFTDVGGSAFSGSPGSVALSSPVLLDASGNLKTGQIAGAQVDASTLSPIGRQQLPALGQQSGSLNASTNSTTYVTLGSFGVTITTTGRPVMIVFQPDATGGGVPGFYESGAGGQVATFQVLRGGTVVSLWQTQVGVTTNFPFLPGPIIDAVPPGTYTYIVQGKTNPSGTAVAGYMTVTAFEL